MLEPSSFVIDAAANAQVDGPTIVVGHGPDGKAIDPASPLCVAKKATDPATGLSNHWLKRASTGPDAGLLFNPYSPNYDRDQARAFHGHLGRAQYEFCRVSQEAFEAFVLFLQTGNLVHQRRAERAANNG